MDLKPAKDVPKDCSQGPGWRGTLETTRGEDGTFSYWASLVKNPRCVFGIELVDKEKTLGKYFWETFNDVTFPIEYLKSNMRIPHLSWRQNVGKTKYSKKTKCYELNAKVNCEEERVKPETVSSSTGNVTIICAIVLTLLCVIFRMFVGWFIYYLFSRSFVCCFVKLTTLN